MSSTELLAAIMSLPVDERACIAEAIWDSINAESEAAGIPQAHKDILDQRLAAYEADPKAGSPWEEVLVRLQSTLPTDAQKQELERRLADHLAHPDHVIPWEEVKAAALARAQS